MFIAAAQVARHGHAERGGKRGAGVAGAVAIVLAFGAEQKAVQALVLPHGVEALAPAGEHLVDVALVAHVEDEFVLRRVENAVQRDGQFHDAEVRPEMAAGLGEDSDQFVAHLLSEKRQIFFLDSLHVRRGLNGGKERLMFHRQQAENPPNLVGRRNFSR